MAVLRDVQITVQPTQVSYEDTLVRATSFIKVKNTSGFSFRASPGQHILRDGQVIWEGWVSECPYEPGQERSIGPLSMEFSASFSVIKWRSSILEVPLLPGQYRMQGAVREYPSGALLGSVDGPVFLNVASPESQGFNWTPVVLLGGAVLLVTTLFRRPRKARR